MFGSGNGLQPRFRASGRGSCRDEQRQHQRTGPRGQASSSITPGNAAAASVPGADSSRAGENQWDSGRPRAREQSASRPSSSSPIPCRTPGDTSTSPSAQADGVGIIETIGGEGRRGGAV